MFWFWITTRIVTNPLSNVLQKKLTLRVVDPIFVVCVTHGMLTLACITSLFLKPLPASSDFWWNIVICTCLNILGNTLLVKAVRLSDLSVLGPINAYKPVLSLIPGFLLLGEVPSMTGLGGIALIVGASSFLAHVRGERTAGLAHLARDPGVRLRFAALVATALEAVFLKKVLDTSSAWTTFVWWSILGFVLAALTMTIIAIIYRRSSQLHTLTSNVKTFVGLAVTTGLMQLSTIVILEQFQVGYSLALFQTSAILSVFLGHRIFQEPDFARRLAASSVMVVGATLIILEK